MINFKKLFETVYEPRSGDEKNFKAKHIVAKYKTPYDTESQFTSNKSKAKRDADHDKGEDEQVYEAAELHTKRADKEPVIVRAVDPKTGQSKAKTVLRRAGEIKIGEEVEQIDELSKKTLGSYVKKASSDAVEKRMKADRLNNAAWTGNKSNAEFDALDKASTKAYKSHHNRLMGISKATDRITKEEVELDEAINADDYTTHGVKSQFGGYRAEIKHKTKGHTMYSGGHTYDSAEKAKGEADAYLKGYSAPGGMGNDGYAQSLARKHAAAHAMKGPFAKKTVKEAMDKVGKEDSDIDNDGDTDKSDKYLHARRKAIGKALKEAEQIDEISQEKISSYYYAAAKDRKKARAEVEKGMAKKNFTPASVQKTADSYKRFVKRGKGMTAAASRMNEEVEMIDEAVKVGALALHDGSSVNVTRAMADTLNAVFEQLTPANRVKMEQKLHTSKKDFNEILKFAESVNG